MSPLAPAPPFLPLASDSTNPFDPASESANPVNLTSDFATPSNPVPTSIDPLNLDAQQGFAQPAIATVPPTEHATTPPGVGESATPPTQEANINQGDSEQREGREADEDQGDDSDEEERAYWADFAEDTSGPDEEELRDIEQEEEKDALDREYQSKAGRLL